jgi:hypothetical protein
MVWNLRAPDRASRDEARLFSRALLFPRERRRAGDVRETLAVDEKGDFSARGRSKQVRMELAGRYSNPELISRLRAALAGI